MKRGLLGAALAMLVGAAPALAQHRAEITPFVGYLFGASVGTVLGDVGVAGDMSYGLILDVNVRHGGQLELSYTRQDSKLTLKQFSGIKRDLTPPVRALPARSTIKRAPRASRANGSAGLHESTLLQTLVGFF
jgi:hypothetical protein